MRKNPRNTARMPKQQTPSRMSRRVGVSSDIRLHSCLSADGGAPTPTTDEDGLLQNAPSRGTKIPRGATGQSWRKQASMLTQILESALLQVYAAISPSFRVETHTLAAWNRCLCLPGMHLFIIFLTAGKVYSTLHSFLPALLPIGG